MKVKAGDAGEAWSDSQIAKALETCLATIARTRKQFVEEGFDTVLTRRHSANSARTRIFDSAAEAKLIALASSEPAKRPRPMDVELDIAAKTNDNTIGRTLKDMPKPHLNQQFIIPPEANGALLAVSEAVLKFYHRLHDPDRPIVCRDRPKSGAPGN